MHVGSRRGADRHLPHRADLFAADVRAVERVLPLPTLPTPFPDVPPWVAGVLEYQQRVVPVIDLRVRFEAGWRRVPRPTPGSSSSIPNGGGQPEWWMRCWM